jgi:hypothetical protein
MNFIEVIKILIEVRKYRVAPVATVEQWGRAGAAWSAMEATTSLPAMEKGFWTKWGARRSAKRLNKLAPEFTWVVTDFWGSDISKKKSETKAR